MNANKSGLGCLECCPMTGCIADVDVPVKVGGQIRRGINRSMIILQNGEQNERFILEKHEQSDLIRFRNTVNLNPYGKISPERSGIVQIIIPGKEMFFVYYRALWSVINPQGKAISAPIYSEPKGWGGR